jgi:5-methylcytosine-specific restriction enzyme B
MTESAVIERLQQLYQALDAQGKILSKAKLEGYYRTFRNRFGPDILASLDGEGLLNEMHNVSGYNSLNYWLEFKNDDDFPAIYGGIAGGTALKFGIYKRKETGAWMVRRIFD